MFQFVDSDDEGVMWFDDAQAPGFGHESWSALVDEMEPSMQSSPVVALAFILGLWRFGVAAYCSE